MRVLFLGNKVSNFYSLEKKRANWNSWELHWFMGCCIWVPVFVHLVMCACVMLALIVIKISFLQEYASILYHRKFENFLIILRGKPVQQHNIADELQFSKVIPYRPNLGIGAKEVTFVMDISNFVLFLSYVFCTIDMPIFLTYTCLSTMQLVSGFFCTWCGLARIHWWIPRRSCCGWWIRHWCF